jgi:hypothetical protein
MATKRTKKRSQSDAMTPILAPSPTVVPADSEPETAHERHTRLAASSPLSLHFELMGCELATTHAQEGAAIPTYTFQRPCPFGKTTPDQDCRMCRHLLLQRVGAGQPLDGTHRYPAFGLVIPLTEALADKIIDLIHADGSAILAQPEWQRVHAVEQEQHAAILAQQERNRDLEQQQRGQG